LEIIEALKLIKRNKLALLLKEANELTEILGVARRTATKKIAS
jgi:hypothetical protein